MTKLEFLNKRPLYLKLMLSLAFKDQTLDTLKDEVQDLLEIHNELMATNPSYKALFERLAHKGPPKHDCSLSKKYYTAAICGNRLMNVLCDASLTIRDLCQHFSVVSSAPKQLWQKACLHKGMSPD